MAAAAIIPAISLAIAAAGTAVTIAGQVQQRKEAKAMGEYNAAVSRNNGIAAQQQANSNADLIRQRYKRTISSQNALLSKSGVQLTGTAQDLEADSETSGELDALTEQYKGKLAFTNGGNQSGLNLLEGNNRASAAGAAAMGSALKGGVAVASQAYNTNWDARPASIPPQPAMAS